MNVSRRKTKKRTGSGFVAGIAAKIQNYPALAGGGAALSVAMMLITINAVWYQPDKHPSPIYSTRTDLPQTIAKSSRSGFTGSITSQTVKTTYAVQPLGAPKAKPVADELTKEIQTALAEKEIYSGSIDGIYGSRTRAAIIAYQQNENLKATGEVSSKLLSNILLSGKQTKPATTIAQKIAAAETQDSGQGNIDRGLVSAIQSGLKNYGYDDIIIDGVMGTQTSQAIRRFELDYGLQITGKASQQILKKLTAIGVIDLG